MTEQEQVKELAQISRVAIFDKEKGTGLVGEMISFRQVLAIIVMETDKDDPDLEDFLKQYREASATLRKFLEL